MNAIDAEGFPHGEIGYREHRCRCDECTTWQQTSGHPVIDPDPARHGSTTTYRKGCRCAQCKAAKNATRPKGPRTSPGPGATHGTNSTYAAGCSCELCKAAHARYKAQRRADQAARGAITHGTTSGYAAKCRCPECKAAHALAARASRQRARARAAASGPYVLDLSNLPTENSTPATIREVGAA